jgi:hypothetical protein
VYCLREGAAKAWHVQKERATLPRRVVADRPAAEQLR